MLPWIYIRIKIHNNPFLNEKYSYIEFPFEDSFLVASSNEEKKTQSGIPIHRNRRASECN
jgi:hypothetical protein